MNIHLFRRRKRDTQPVKQEVSKPVADDVTTTVVTPKKLPASARPKDTKSTLLARPLGHIAYSDEDTTDRDLWVAPLWTQAVSKEFARVNNADELLREDLAQKDRIAVVHGTFEDALKIAAERSNSTYSFNQAQAIVEGSEGEWFVAAVGQFRNKQFEYIAVDGTSNGNTFQDVFGAITSVRRDNPNFVALVGAQDWLDFREPPTDEPAKERTSEPEPQAEKPKDPWAVENS